jgi:hypothetical protein
MLRTIDILSTIEEQDVYDVKYLAKRLQVPLEQLKEILINMRRHSLIEYDPRTGKVTLPTWLINIERKMEKMKPATGEMIIPKYQEIKIQDIIIGNFTKNDLELKLRLNAKLKEIAICDTS